MTVRPFLYGAVFFLACTTFTLAVTVVNSPNPGCEFPDGLLHGMR